MSNEDAGKFLPVGRRNSRTGQYKHNQRTGRPAAKRKAWPDEAKADGEEIGGAKWDETPHIAAKGPDAVGFKKGHPFRLALEETGFGNNVHMIRLAKTLGDMVGEDGNFVRSDAGLLRQAPVRRSLVFQTGG